MDNNRKKVLLIPFDGILTKEHTFDINKGICDKIRRMPNVQRVAIIADKSDDAFYNARKKSVEFFVFMYCNTAVSTHERGDGMVESIMDMLPHNIRKKDYMLSVGEKIEGIDYVEPNDFVK